jgi:hypothetical protein
VPGRYFLVSPGSRTSWEFNWSNWLAVDETIDTHSWSISPLNGTSPETPIVEGQTAQVCFVSGLLQGRVYTLTDRIVTSASAINEQSLTLRCDPT